MFFNLRDLELRKVRFNVSFQPGEIDFQESGLTQVGSLDAEGSAELLGNTVGEVRVQGRLRVTMQAECDRCLDSARFPIESSFDLFYRPAAPAHAHRPSEEVEIDESEAEIGFYEGGGLELKDLLREHILLSMPMQRICGELCKGICPVCGENRNTAACECQVKPGDDRWAALKHLSTRGI